MNTPARITNVTAVFSLIFGALCWVAIPFIGAIVAVVCGHIARREIRRAPPDTMDGDGLALTGLILGYAHFAFLLLVVLTLLGLFGAVYHH
jgi:Domain of unknown function (DUF4190)